MTKISTWKAIISFTQSFQIKPVSTSRISKWLLVGMLPTAIVFFSGCEEPIQGIGKEVLPPGDIIETYYTDSLEIEFRTIRLDTINSYNSEYQLVGNYVDPQFGRISASTYTQVLSRTSPIVGDPDLLYDSLVLNLQVASYYGRLDQPQVIRIYEITGDWPEEEDINSETTLEYSANLLADPTPIYLDEAGTAEISIRLSDELGRRLLYADPDTLGDRDLFNEFFKGLYITSEPVKHYNREPGAILRLLGNSSNTQLELHYREEDTTATIFRAKVEPFQISSSTPKFHHVTRTQEAETLLDIEGPALAGDDEKEQFEFLQGVVQVRNYIRFPDVDQLGNVAIHNASLTLKVDPETLGSEDRYSPPTAILPLVADSTYAIKFGEDGAIELVTSLSDVVFYNSNDATYTIDLTRYIQEILTGARENTGFVLLPSGAGNRVDRAILGGTGHPSLAPQLSIIYSTLLD